jgi:hypothetical protein
MRLNAEGEQPLTGAEGDAEDDSAGGGGASQQHAGVSHAFSFASFPLIRSAPTAPLASASTRFGLGHRMQSWAARLKNIFGGSTPRRPIVGLRRASGDVLTSTHIKIASSHRIHIFRKIRCTYCIVTSHDFASYGIFNHRKKYSG